MPLHILCCGAIGFASGSATQQRNQVPQPRCASSVSFWSVKVMGMGLSFVIFLAIG
jgi:hypothetical protein